ncbi:LPXTG cell wall anchor domain-containing protein [Streptococcus suis]|uniref:LPXTG cell wall anchor domain-containing protein n=1 Tax=Streptococcus suis TaxID=1307 RepID=UPI0038BBAD97
MQVDVKQAAAADSPATKPSQATSRLPETGDNMNLVTTVSGLALLGLAISKRKQESE